jgi:hypothetical protein
MFRLMYVFDPREATGYVCRLPEFLARILVRVVRKWDYALDESGLRKLSPKELAVLDLALESALARQLFWYNPSMHETARILRADVSNLMERDNHLGSSGD